MTARGQVLENHTLIVRNGRILEVLPTADAIRRYAAAVHIQRRAHLLMPGMISTHTRAASSLFRGSDSPVSAHETRFVSPEFVRDGVLAAIAEMLLSGISCFGDRYYYPGETARAAGEQGMRAVVGLPVADIASPWSGSSQEYLTEGLRIRDEYAGHPLISTVFAPQAPDQMCDATFARIATLADELDAGIVIDLHRSSDEIARSVAVYGVRPIERLWQLGLLTPALNAVHMAHATEADVDLARRTGIAISLCARSSLQYGQRLPPVGSFVASGVRLGFGAGEGVCRNQDVWDEMKLFALMTSHLRPAGGPDHCAWDALAVATRGGAAVLGLDADTGTLELGKWADLCCVDLDAPCIQPVRDPVRQLVFCGGRDIVSDVWVAGRQLVSEGQLTRLEWPDIAARANGWAVRMEAGG